MRRVFIWKLTMNGQHEQVAHALAAMLVAPAQLVERMQALEKEVRALRSERDTPELWDAERIAEWLGFSVSHIRQAVINQPDFPRSVTSSAQKRWFSADVIEWARRNSGSVQRKAGRRRAAL
jgi:predicted DNA-binding transcriptional regulator AlpA